MKLLLIIALTFSLTSCGSLKKGIKVEMALDARIQTESAVELINTVANKNLVKLVDTNEYILIYKVPNESLAGHIAGVAYVGGVKCKIAIPERTFDEGVDFLSTVVWHEVGHCYKLNHSSNANDIMYKSVYPLSFYHEDIKQRFLRRLYEVAH